MKCLFWFGFWRGWREGKSDWAKQERSKPRILGNLQIVVDFQYNDHKMLPIGMR